MDKLREVWQSISLRLVGLLKSFENSALFDRLMHRYESLSSRGQRMVNGAFKLGGMLFIAFLVFGGPFLLLYKIQKIKTLERLEVAAATYQSDYDAVTKGYTSPVGWKPFASGSADELAASFNDYLLSIGVPEEFGTLVASGESLNLTLREVSIRQATNMMFQLEALFPKLRARSFAARPNAANAEIIDMEATFVFNPAFAAQFAADGSGGGAAPMFEEDSFPDEPAPAPSNPPPRSNRATPPAGSDNADLQGEYVPPPAPPQGDFEEFAPPEIPDDFSAPPPPPGFEEE